MCSSEGRKHDIGVRCGVCVCVCVCESDTFSMVSLNESLAHKFSNEIILFSTNQFYIIMDALFKRMGQSCHHSFSF